MQKFHKPTFDNIPQQKRDKILETAVSEFANKGFENANINTIAKNAGVSVGSLYKYFDTKTDLFLTCVSSGITALEALLSELVSSNEDIMLKMEKLARTAISFSRENREMIRLYNEFTTESNTELAESLVDRVEAVTAKAYRDAIEDGQKSGEVRSDIDAGMAALMVDNILMNLRFSYACSYHEKRFCAYAGKDAYEKEEFVIENVLKFIKSALKPKNNAERTENK